MADARQKEMKVSITVVATKTFMAGLEPSTDVAMLQRNVDSQIRISIEDSTGKVDREDPGESRVNVPESLRQARSSVWLMLLWCKIRMCDAVVPAERVFVEENPDVSHAERNG